MFLKKILMKVMKISILTNPETDKELIYSNDYRSDDISKLFEKENIKVNNSLTCNYPIEIPQYSSGLFEGTVGPLCTDTVVLGKKYRYIELSVHIIIHYYRGYEMGHEKFIGTCNYRYI